MDCWRACRSEGACRLRPYYFVLCSRNKQLSRYLGSVRRLAVVESLMLEAVASSWDIVDQPEGPRYLATLTRIHEWYINCETKHFSYDFTCDAQRKSHNVHGWHATGT